MATLYQVPLQAQLTLNHWDVSASQGSSLGSLLSSPLLSSLYLLSLGKFIHSPGFSDISRPSYYPSYWTWISHHLLKPPKVNFPSLRNLLPAHLQHSPVEARNPQFLLNSLVLPPSNFQSIKKYYWFKFLIISLTFSLLFFPMCTTIDFATIISCQYHSSDLTDPLSLVLSLQILHTATRMVFPK